VEKTPTKFVARLTDNKLKARIYQALVDLAEDPRPVGSTKLQGSDNLYRIRVSDYRVIYAIQDAVLIVLVVEIGHRREVYRAS
jgi:mRNA interferase RelE/StbE